jgi:dolichol-phosphate mannosyltransferase
MSLRPFVSVIVPTFNEKDNILVLIEKIHDELSDVDHEIVIVDDNSPDGTYNIVNEKKYPFVKTVLRTSDPSLAKSIRTGLENAHGNIFVVMDSDFNHQPKYIPRMVRNLDFYGCVSASRFVYGGLMDSPSRHILSWIFNIFVRTMTGKFVTDNLYGFFAIRKEIMEKLDYDKIFWGYGDYCIRLMYYLQEQGVEILQFPAVNGKRLKGQGNSRFLKVFAQYTRETFSLVWREKWCKGRKHGVSGNK